MSKLRFQRHTRQRQVILEELSKLTSHPTAPALYEVVRRRLPSVSLATVYRNLERLSEMGLVRKLEISGAQTRFDGDTGPHDHVRCVKCGRVDDLEPEAVERPVLDNGHAGGYEILGLRLEFYGVCPGCRQPAASNACHNQGEIPC